MLFINALDDPLIEESVLPHINEFPSQTQVEFYPHGGHVGFITQSSQGLLTTEYWLSLKILNYLHDHLYCEEKKPVLDEDETTHALTEKSSDTEQ